MADESDNQATASGCEVATLAGGCFWCTEAVLASLDGVLSVTSGYTGGSAPDPDYHSVCSGETGHAEAVRVVFDPQVLAYGDLLEVFFALHDPTTADRQGNDIGTQYRSVIFFHSRAQQAAAQALIQRLTQEQAFATRIVTQVMPAPRFFAAEGYHQHYYSNNSSQSYCQYVIAPKLAKLRSKFAARLKPAAR